MFKLIVVGLCCYNLVQCKDPAIEEEELEASNFLAAINKKTEENEKKVALANWAYASNLTDENLKNQLSVAAQAAKSEKEIWQQVTQYDWSRFSDYSLKRQFQKYSILGSSALPEEKFKRLHKIVSDMEATYSKAKICSFHDPKDCDLALEPDLTNILADSRNPEELKHVWLQWRNSIDSNNFTDNSEYWLHDYEDPNIKQQIQDLWEQLKPLYLQIHAYVRSKLRQKYGDIVSEKGPIPVHLLGNMWGQTWSNIADFTLPYSGLEDEDLEAELVKQNYTAIRIFRTAEEFFKSINLTEMPPSFWEKSILTKPKDRDLICHASAWDFYDGRDFRIKQCTEVTKEQFIVAHHEMGHIEYFLQYKDQPVKFREGANDGFHEAVGDLISLSVRSTKHLRKIGLLKSENDDPNIVLNNLFKVGLDNIVFLPFGYLMDLWRWDVFSGKTKPEDYNCKWWELRENIKASNLLWIDLRKILIPPLNTTLLLMFLISGWTRQHSIFCLSATLWIYGDGMFFSGKTKPEDYNCKWWELREKYQGVEPPVDRSEEDFDPAAKYHIIADVPYLRKMLAMGSSRPWPDAMEVMTGQRNMDASGILDYFKPLQQWLEKENAKNGAYIGWEISKRVCVRTRKELESKKDD
ncbi:hypothetical protein NQ317_002029 [Molorchus minor]|uniref:Angiotensin-converting enzyme n=1 Tax=Molorchus minor TaxID=1323400 RepID=A0ABQ9JJV7_9CUCU|nr:hypothetical protein NQ317_002029 [Molorchus minor]